MSKQRVGITGQQGFIGQALFNTLGLHAYEFERVQFERDFFDDQAKLERFVSECDVIVHLAAMNRHHDPAVIYETNISLVLKLINALEKSKSTPHVFFSSSSQEEKDNLYGRSKKEGRELLSNWASKSEALYTGMIIPNVFGPFGNPYYNSFIATFSYQLTHGEQPKIDIDGQVKLIYVNELVNFFLKEIRSKTGKALLNIPHTSEHKVSEIFEILKRYKVQYFENGIIPNLKSPFEINLFNTFRSYIDHKNHFPVNYEKNTDLRGSFVELIRLNVGGQVSLSTTIPGITRGNHYHTRKIERFSVIKGKALIQLRKIGTSEVLDFYLDGNEPSYVDMPIWYTHSIKNIGNDELYTNFWINEFYDANDPDTYFENV
jgi:UDP-2-acetamido-2,6-beta-L-arabino-hexul-4-ose reductase